jgi:hypothetical protein
MKELENENELADALTEKFPSLYISVRPEQRLKNGKLKTMGYVELMPNTPEEAFDTIKCIGENRFTFAGQIAELLTK